MKNLRIKRYAIGLLIVAMTIVGALSIVTAQEAVEVADPIPYPEANDLGVGGGEVNKQDISEIVTYMAMDSYNQSPSLDAFVESGELPPVEERLPAEPAVYLTSGMKDGIGVYGGMFRGFSACPTNGYNTMFSGISMGWFGIESYTDRYNGLVKTGPLYRVNQDIEPMPNLAKSWEWSEDGMSITFHLIEGASWSDGQPFTAEDVVWTWDAYIEDENVSTSRSLESWTWDGGTADMELVDDYTVRINFPVSKPLDMWYLINEGNFRAMPKHKLAEFHPEYSTRDPLPTYDEFQNAWTPETLPLVTMGPWVVTEYKTDELMIMRRNPYYWKVDEAGNQLPYMDEIQYRKGPSGIGRDLCTIAGDCDHMNLENPSTYVEAMTQAQEDDSSYTINWGPELLGFSVQFNFSLQLGIEGDRDIAVRELFRDLRFRQAVSYAADREGISQSIMRGPFVRGWAGGLFPGSPSFDREAVVYYPYDVASANALLDDMGLMDTDGDGTREWTEGSMAGEPLVFELRVSQDRAEEQSIGEALVNQWGEIGLQINMRVTDSATQTDIEESGTWDMKTNRAEQGFALPFTNITDLGPIESQFTNHRVPAGEERQMMDFEQEILDILQEYRGTFDAEGRDALMSRYNQIFTENVYEMGTIVSRHGLGLAKRSKNVADGTPVFMYTWVEDAILLDAVWTPEDEQLPQNRPDTIPVYSD